MNDRLTYLKKETIKYAGLMIGCIFGNIIFNVSIVYIIISMILHWIRNDTMTVMQILKWTFSCNWGLILFIIIWILFKSKREDIVYTYKSFYSQLQNELHKENENEKR